MPFPPEFVKIFETGQTLPRKYSLEQKGTACSLHFAFYLTSALQINSLGQGEGGGHCPKGHCNAHGFLVFYSFHSEWAEFRTIKELAFFFKAYPQN